MKERPQGYKHLLECGQGKEYLVWEARKHSLEIENISNN